MVRLQSAIFLFDVQRAMALIQAHDCDGFSKKVAHKTLIHLLFEYNKALSGLYQRVKLMANNTGVVVDDAAYLAEKNKWREQLKLLDKYRPVRNLAAGHYDADIAKQVSALSSIDADEVHAVALVFLHWNRAFILLLRDAGELLSAEVAK